MCGGGGGRGGSPVEVVRVVRGGRSKQSGRLTATHVGPPVSGGLMFVDQVPLFHLKKRNLKQF